MQPDYVVVADLIRERDEAREQVRSLTVERDAAREEAAWMKSERDKWRDFKPVTADLVDRISRAREALGLLLHCGPRGYELEALLDTAEEVQALGALRAALAEPLGGP